jgi:hypothetical protein
MNRIRSADTAPPDDTSDIFAPESSLLSIEVRRPQGAVQRAVTPLHATWHAAYDPITGIADEAVLKAGMGRAWAESFMLERPSRLERFIGSHRFTIQPMGRLPRDIQALLADGEGLPSLMEQINQMAMVNCHSVRPVSGVIELDDGYITGIRLTLLPLASREGVVHRYLGTLGNIGTATSYAQD